MIARLEIYLPYTFTIRNKVKVKVFSYFDAGYSISVYSPIGSNVPPSKNDFEKVKINNKASFYANVLRIDFHKDEFDRRKEPGIFDPPLDLMERTANSWLKKLRYSLFNFRIKPIRLVDVNWSVHYLNNDGSELPNENKLSNTKAKIGFQFEFNSLPREIWNNLYKLEEPFQLPTWYDFQLDAWDALERDEIGLSMVLAFTSLEVFIPFILDKFAKKQVKPQKMWIWINNHNNREPDVSDQFNGLLEVFTGSRLIEEPKLWKAFNEIREARNKFVHEGIASIKNIPVNAKKATELLQETRNIVSFIKNKLPKSMRWIEFDEIRQSVEYIKNLESSK